MWLTQVSRLGALLNSVAVPFLFDCHPGTTTEAFPSSFILRTPKIVANTFRKNCRHFRKLTTKETRWVSDWLRWSKRPPDVKSDIRIYVNRPANRQHKPRGSPIWLRLFSFWFHVLALRGLSKRTNNEELWKVTWRERKSKKFAFFSPS